MNRQAMKVYSEMSRTQFAKEIGRTLVVGTASTTGIYLGLIATGYVCVAINRLIKSKKED
jgi:hypothetical protein